MEVPSMHPISLRELEAAGVAKVVGEQVGFTIRHEWCASGEDRLGYSGVVRLMECVRELHWRRDVTARRSDIDTITKSLEVEFLRPMIAGSAVTGAYSVSGVGSRSYVLKISLCDQTSLETLASGQLISVFYDGANHEVVGPPPSLATALRALSHERP